MRRRRAGDGRLRPRQSGATARRAARFRREAGAYTGYWWEDPARLVLIFILPLYGMLSLSLLVNQKSIARLYFDGYYALVGALFLLVVVVTAWLATTEAQSRRGPPAAPAELPAGVLDFVFVLALFGNLMLLGGIFARPALLLAFLHGEANAYVMLEQKGHFTGLSSFTQAAAPYVALYFYVFKTPVKGVNRYKVYLGVLAVLTLLRSFIFAERLALIEVALPCALMIVRFRLGGRFSRLLTLGPYAAIPLLFGLFIANEYNRSWEAYYVTIYDNLFDFALERLGLYYSTALNNGAGILSVLGWDRGHPMFTFDWLLHFPIIGAPLQPWLDSTDSITVFLNSYADPEFNNPSGIFVHFYEWGWFGLLDAVVLGWVFGRSYAGWRSGAGFWCCAHAVLYVSIMEILRIPNLFSGRNFVPIVLLIAVFRYFVKRPASVAPATHPAAP
ncbi:oligosaccharide repeat unit polymerase [Burkholderia sp. Bp9099]|uniref:oligosaccharide repeat unit polymerase n=1 Tax=Burkholderia sp. Bp9099 TaxID=2184568 RepID=UPI000F5E6905|nr:oligosaccharide repeat unit polymerase [Burkholderia sp. Bp9099]RQZ52145.1 oligosaccharide repeat unit polymerase [Burkholderia sp. Bp9099]